MSACCCCMAQCCFRFRELFAPRRAHGEFRCASRCKPSLWQAVWTSSEKHRQKKWSARFEFKRQGTGSTTLDGPARVVWADAEADRQFVAAAMSQVSQSTRPDVASIAIQTLRIGGTKTQGPGALAKMNKKQLRNLATRTPGIVINKKNQKGKWIPKPTKELKEELLALGAGTSTHALPGRIKKKPASLKVRRERKSSKSMERPSSA